MKIVFGISLALNLILGILYFTKLNADSVLAVNFVEASVAPQGEEFVEKIWESQSVHKEVSLLALLRDSNVTPRTKAAVVKKINADSVLASSLNLRQGAFVDQLILTKLEKKCGPQCIAELIRFYQSYQHESCRIEQSVASLYGQVAGAPTLQLQEVNESMALNILKKNGEVANSILKKEYKSDSLQASPFMKALSKEIVNP